MFFAAGRGRLDVRRREQLEVVVADVEDFRVGDAGLPRQHLLGALLVGQREIIALGGRPDEARQHVAAFRDALRA